VCEINSRICNLGKAKGTGGEDAPRLSAPFCGKRELAKGDEWSDTGTSGAG